MDGGIFLALTKRDDYGWGYLLAATKMMFIDGAIS